MREPRPIRGSPLPLFDRLAQGSPESEGKREVLDSRALRDSILRELTRLLNTRSSVHGSSLRLAAGTVLDYGLPDFSAFAPASDADRNVVARRIADHISAHEPRLRQPRVVLHPDPASPRAVTGVIAATLVMGTVYEPVTFRLSMELGSPSGSISLT